MGHVKASTFLSRLKDPNAWVCLIAVFVVLGLLGGAFEPAEPDRLGDSGSPELLRLASADQPR